MLHCLLMDPRVLECCALSLSGYLLERLALWGHTLACPSPPHRPTIPSWTRAPTCPHFKTTFIHSVCFVPRPGTTRRSPFSAPKCVGFRDRARAPGLVTNTALPPVFQRSLSSLSYVVCTQVPSGSPQLPGCERPDVGAINHVPSLTCPRHYSYPVCLICSFLSQSMLDTTGPWGQAHTRGEQLNPGWLSWPALPRPPSNLNLSLSHSV